MFVGGFVFHRIGGYNNPMALTIAVIVITIGGFCGVPSVFTDNINVVIILLWI